MSLNSAKDQAEINAWRKPKVGDQMKTPTGVVTVTAVSEFRWSGSSDKTGYGNIPFWEGGNWRTFKVIN